MLLLDHPVASCSSPAPTRDAAAACEISELRQALRDSRQRLRRSALQGVRQLAALNGEIARLQQVCTTQAAQLRRYEESFALLELACARLGRGRDDRQERVADEALCHSC